MNQIFSRRTLSLFILTVFSFLGGETRLSASQTSWLPNTCGNLEIILVEPDSPDSDVQVNCRRPHSQECKVKKGFAKFKVAYLAGGGTALKVKRSTPDDLEGRYLQVLRRSPLMQEMAFLRVQARQISRKTPACEPLLMYLKDASIFGTGPVFVNGFRFFMEGRVYSNFIAGEDVRHPVLPTIDAISKASLLLKGYFDPVFAHESAHGLMQDLYGVREFRELEERHMVATAGHFEGATTDPATALVEGFAEAFEAYLGEKYIKPANLVAVPDLDRLANTSRHRLDLWSEGGAMNIARYFAGVPMTLLTFYRTLIQTDDLITDWLKLHRQAPIRNGTYLYNGDYAAFGHHYGIMMGNPMRSVPEYEIEATVDGTPTKTDTLYSKEGVVAFIIYHFLKNGLARPLFDAMAEAKPVNLHQLLAAFLPRLSPQQKDSIQTVLVATFNPAARAHWGEMLSSAESLPAGRARNRRGDELFASNWIASLPASSRDLSRMAIPPREFWIEFESSPEVSWWEEIFGNEKVLQRVNLATAGFTEIYNFIDTVDMSVLRNVRPAAIFAIQRVLLENPGMANVEELIVKLKAFTLAQSRLERGRRIQNVGDLDVALNSFIFPKLREARRCFESRCLTR